ncbi:glycosyltransferase family 25 protein [Prosthecodimorpha staleyi]|uniref:Glycosyltransferase family 25 protein n=1 Tax=Prosthecodimorpha staleyi TaxID=2840188 RepID=A0A947GHT2_9HYPH|nr:glycosyltransferase family 25 protein [Prosthecodimorpha staleyi]MBT9287914.1 glycosyltransferase family 25 protein [Prosthecodimorpha staleyi]
MIPCYVINLRSRVDRAERIGRVFGGLGIAFRRIDAIPVTEVSDELSRTWVPPGRDRPLAVAHVACFLSHMRAWQAIADGSDRYGAVFEDDVILAPDIAAFLGVEDWIPAGADVVKLETKETPEARIDRRASGALGRHKVHRLRGKHLGAAGYVLSREMALRLLQRDLPKYPVDRVLFHETEGLLSHWNIHQVVPGLCIQGSVLARIEGRPPEREFVSDIAALSRDERVGPKPARPRHLRRRGRGLLKAQMVLARLGHQFGLLLRGQKGGAIPFRD